MPVLIHQNFHNGVIITHGLGADARSGSLITAFKFSLFGCEATIKRGTGGGSIPLAPGEIHKLFKPVDPQFKGQTKPPFYIPVELKQPKDIVSFIVNFGDKTFEREFLVTREKSETIVKVLEIVNITKTRINVIISGLKNKIQSIIVSIKDLKNISNK